MPPRIRVIGSLNIDFTTVTERFPGPGETITAKSLSVNAGGKGANQAVACGRASFTSKGVNDVVVEMIGAVGANDPYYASLLKPTLEKSGVDCMGIRQVEGSQTGTATIIVDEGSGGENRILVVPGANHEGMINAQEVTELASKEPLPDVLLMQGEIPRNTVLEILRHFKDKKGSHTRIILNPAPVFPEGIPGTLLDGLSVLIMNETETLQLARTTEATRTFPNETHEELERSTLDQISVDFHKAGVGIVVVTLGGRGVYYSSSWHVQGLVPAVEVKRVVDTTGAGDSFVGYFSVALARFLYHSRKDGLGKVENFDLKGAVQRANDAGAKCVQRSGAMQSIPWGYE